MNRDWHFPKPVKITDELHKLVGGHPLVAQLLVQRGFDTPARIQAFLDSSCYTPTPATALYGVAEAARLLHEAVSERKKILVWGDFDVDGQTSTSLLVAALQELVGPSHIRFHIPNRFQEGHGIQLEKLKTILQHPNFHPHVLITCDTGIAEAEAIGYAKDQGLMVIVTDHHDLTPEFQGISPETDELWGQDADAVGVASVRRADAIVNPKFQLEEDPLRTLPGVGVAYKLVQRLYEVSGHAGKEEALLDLVALGIVADVAEQVNDARYLLQRGLEQLRKTRRTGLLALMDIARLNPATVGAEEIGFQLGPRMNALGRLEDATVSVELLTTRDAVRAGQLAGKLERLNQERRLLTKQTTLVALEMLDRNPKLLDFNGLVLTHPAWHPGIVGIVAARLVEQFNKPTVLLLNPPGLEARGSARSIPSVDIGSAIAGCGHLLIGHGGHPGAAGVTLLPENIDHFRRELDRQIALNQIEDAPSGLMIDAKVPHGELSLSLAEEVGRLSPFGQGNPTPQFLTSHLRVVSDKRIGKEGAHRRLIVQGDDGPKVPVIWFNGADQTLPNGPMDLVYTLNINAFRGERNLQLGYLASRPTAEDDGGVEAGAVGQAVLHDLRNQAIKMADLPAPSQAIWYVEGTLLSYQGQAISYAPRTTVQERLEHRTLVLWTIPASSQLLQWIIETAQPEAIYLCGQKTTDDSLSELLRQTAGMCKYALNRDRLLPIDRLAARLGTTEGVIRHGLLWLESRGMVKMVEWGEDDTICIAEGDGREDKEMNVILKTELEAQLAEVRAYRRFFIRAKLDELRIGVGK